MVYETTLVLNCKHGRKYFMFEKRE